MDIPKFAKQETEDDIFWKNHLDLQSTSKLSQLAYCRENHLDYGRFHYRFKKYKKASVKKPLVAVKLKISPIGPVQPLSLCTLTLSKGFQLHIHDANALAFVLDKLVTC